MFFYKGLKHILKKKIEQLDNVLLRDEIFTSVEYMLDLDKKISITSKIRMNKHLSFREYLIDLVDKDYKKAVAIYDIINSANTLNKDKVYKGALKQGLVKQRSWLASDKTVGQQIFEQALSLQIEEFDEYVYMNFKENVKGLSSTVHEFPVTYVPSPLIKTDRTLTAIRLFDDIHPSLYRRGVYTCSRQSDGTITLDFPNDISEFDLPAVLDEKLQSAVIREIPKLPVRGKMNEWVPLTTLTMNDTIVNVQATTHC